MQTSPFDFVGALVAEEQCPLCSELHAAVDECFCTSCLTHVCRDCSSLQPDTTWICRSCEVLLPPRAYPVAVQSAQARLTHARHAAREHIELWMRELAPRLARAQQVVMLQWVALLAWSRALVARQRPRLHMLALDARTGSERAVRRLARDSTRAREWAVRNTQATVQFVRAWPMRAHCTSLLIATIILIAVARADNAAD